MNILYDRVRREYILGTQRYSKQDFLAYIESDMLEAALTAEVSEINMQEQTNEINVNEAERIPGGRSILLYGVPGSGKSWNINNKYCKDSHNIERIVFYPDYTHSDFVGQLLPDPDKGIKFEPGPFTRILKEAYLHAKNKYYLIIEEINRGNAAAILGDIFQLIDRKDEIKENDDGYQLGTSEYEITNYNIAEEVYGDKNHKIRIPSNLSIIATMNTSDQNVFTVDTAFQRRWEMELLESGFEKVNTEFANTKILDTTVTWEKFCTTINNIILEKSVAMLSSEDKRLGAYFVKAKDLAYTEDAEKFRFSEKVIKYLWDDAFKFYREKIFATEEYNCLEKVIKKFNNANGNERFKIFKENIYEKIVD